MGLRFARNRVVIRKAISPLPSARGDAAVIFPSVVLAQVRMGLEKAVHLHEPAGSPRPRHPRRRAGGVRGESEAGALASRGDTQTHGYRPPTAIVVLAL